MNRSRIRLAAALLAIAAALMPFFSMKSYARSETATVGKSFDVYLVGYSESMVEIAGISGSLPPGIKYYTGDGRGIGVRGTPTQAGSYSATFYYTVENVYTGSTYEDSISIDIIVKAAPTPTPKQADPAPTPTPEQKKTSKVTVTKSPTDEVVAEGGSCKFIGKADNDKKAVWHFVSPDGKTDMNYSKIEKTFPGLKISGGSGDKLTLSNIPYAMDGWSVYCRYSNGDDNVAKTERASITVIPETVLVTATPEPTATPAPSAVPTPEPTPEPTQEPTQEPTPEPTEEPVQQLTPEPTAEPAAKPAIQTGTGGASQNSGGMSMTNALILAAAAVLIVLILCVTAIILSKNRKR